MPVARESPGVVLTTASTSLSGVCSSPRVRQRTVDLQGRNHRSSVIDDGEKQCVEADTKRPETLPAPLQAVRSTPAEQVFRRW
jgi:hypothetical protein